MSISVGFRHRNETGTIFAAELIQTSIQHKRAIPDFFRLRYRTLSAKSSSQAVKQLSSQAFRRSRQGSLSDLIRGFYSDPTSKHPRLRSRFVSLRELAMQCVSSPQGKKGESLVPNGCWRDPTFWKQARLNDFQGPCQHELTNTRTAVDL